MWTKVRNLRNSLNCFISHWLNNWSSKDKVNSVFYLSFKSQNEKASRFCEFGGHNFKLWSSLPETMWDKLSKYFVTINNNIHYFLVFLRGQIVYVQYSNHPELKTEPSQHSVGVSILGHYLLKVFFCSFFTIFEC